MTKILIIGSTGKLGSKLINFCLKNKIKISAITCYKNKKKLISQSTALKSKYFSLYEEKEKSKFIKYISNEKFDLVYFLDYGANSLLYFKYLINKKIDTIFAIANKELLFAGGSFLVKSIKKHNKKLIPLDSEHFSLFKSDPINNHLNKIYITASGGPFYFKPEINLNNVSLKEVLNHPKWTMGINNSIDSSNFINKILEIYELSSIYQIDLKKIDFLISKNAFIHSIIHYKDNTISLNCFNNDMIISLTYPLKFFFEFNLSKTSYKKLLNNDNMQLEKFNDKRFKINKYLKYIKLFNHHQQIQFMILNNIAQKRYLDNKLNYNNIFDFIMKNIDLNLRPKSFRKIDEILLYMEKLLKKYAAS